MSSFLAQLHPGTVVNGWHLGPRMDYFCSGPVRQPLTPHQSGISAVRLITSSRLIGGSFLSFPMNPIRILTGSPRDFAVTLGRELLCYEVIAQILDSEEKLQFGKRKTDSWKRENRQELEESQ